MVVPKTEKDFDLLVFFQKRVLERGRDHTKTTLQLVILLSWCRSTRIPHLAAVQARTTCYSCTRIRKQTAGEQTSASMQAIVPAHY
jgi:hypothetical protein